MLLLTSHLDFIIYFLIIMIISLHFRTQHGRQREPENLVLGHSVHWILESMRVECGTYRRALSRYQNGEYYISSIGEGIVHETKNRKF